MGQDRPAVFADANVLFSAALRDILIELALDGRVRLHWSPIVLEEVRTVLLRRSRSVPRKIDSLLLAMDAALPQASVQPDWGRKLETVLPDANDEHVLRAALAAECTVLLTFNLRDFPEAPLALDDDELRPVHPDAFLVQLLTTEAPAVLTVIRRILSQLSSPPMTAETYLSNLERSGVGTSAAMLRHLLGGR